LGGVIKHDHFGIVPSETSDNGDQRPSLRVGERRKLCFGKVVFLHANHKMSSHASCGYNDTTNKPKRIIYGVQGENIMTSLDPFVVHKLSIQDSLTSYMTWVIIN
jgi:hypothetical protein